MRLVLEPKSSALHLQHFLTLYCPHREVADPKIRLKKLSTAMPYTCKWVLYVTIFFLHMAYSPTNPNILEG